jgi:putative DNA primase/helicase
MAASTENAIIDQFLSAARNRGLLIDKIVTDGTLTRCDVLGGKKGKLDGSYLLHLDGIAAGGIQNFRDGQGWQTWKANIARPAPTDAERAAYREHAKATQAQRETDASARHADAAKRGAELWEKSVTPTTENSYLRRKRCGAYGVRGLRSALVVPVKDAAGAWRGLQFIQEDGQKRFLTGTKKEGGFHWLRPPAASTRRIVVAEGYATCATLAQALDASHAIACGFDAQNLEPVAKAIHARYSTAQITVAADDDFKTEGNPGLTHATRAARAVGGLVAVPAFTELRGEKQTDFNDQFCSFENAAQGLAAIRARIESAQPPQAESVTPKPAPQNPSDKKGSATTAPPAMPTRGDSLTPRTPSPKTAPQVSGGGNGANGGSAGSGDSRNDTGDDDEMPYGFFIEGDTLFREAHTPKGAQTIPVSSAVKVVAITRSGAGAGFAKLCVFENHDGKTIELVVPAAQLKGEGGEVVATFLERGLPFVHARESTAFVSYLMLCRPKTRIRTTHQAGWLEGTDTPVFVMGDGTRVSGATDTEGSTSEAIRLEPKDDAASKPFSVAGGVESWKNNVAAYAQANSRFTFAISFALAAPLLKPTFGEGGGVHLRGDPGTGKSTALYVAGSVYGGHDVTKKWLATATAIEAIAARHCDIILNLDELGLCDGGKVSDVIYWLADGSGKSRAARTAQLKETAAWRILFLSSGEMGLADKLAEAQKQIRGGMEGRFLEINAAVPGGFGAYETLHGFATVTEISKHLHRQCAENHGAVGREFIRRVAYEDASTLTALQLASRNDIKAQCVPEHLRSSLPSVIERALDRFGLAAAAGELATEWGLTGWSATEATQAACVMFKAFVSGRGGFHQLEDAAIAGKVQGFIQAHGDNRFANPKHDEGDNKPRIINRAGFLKYSNGKDPEAAGQITAYMVESEVFKTEVVKGYDHAQAVRILARYGLAHMNPKGGISFVVNDPKTKHQHRCICIDPKILAFDMETIGRSTKADKEGGE